MSIKDYLCIYDFDTHLYTGAKMLQDDYIIAEHKATGHRMEHKNITTFKGRKKIIVGGWLGERNAEKGTNLTPDDFIITKHSRRNRIPTKKAKEIITKSIEIVLEKVWCRELRLVIGGKDNYRKDIYPLYKAHRPPKPLMYAEMREWLEEEYESMIVVADGCEADDYLSIMSEWMFRQTKGDFDAWDLVLIHRDKDLKQCGGLQWSWFDKKVKPEWLGAKKAEKAFWQQMLQGDSTDGIPGIGGVTPYMWKEFQLKGKKYGIGAKNALTLLNNCDTVEEMDEMVTYCYRSFYPYYNKLIDEDIEFNKTAKKEDLRPIKDKIYWRDHFQLNYQLLKLQERKGVIPIYEFAESYPELDEEEVE